MWRRASVVSALTFGIVLFSSEQLLEATATSQLRQVIVLSRHGVRGPYGLGEEIPSEETFKKYVLNPNVELPLSANAWGTSESDDPTEVVSPKLTKHGFNVVKLMGEYFREHLYNEFLEAKCDKTFAYADANQRDNLTAQAFLRGLYPDCKDVVPITAETRLLFEQGQDPTANCPVCSKTVYEGITGANDTRYLVQEIRDEITQINDILECCAASVCSASEEDNGKDDEGSDTGTCGLFDVPSEWDGAFYAPWKDTMSTADYFSEFWLLQSLNNMTLPSGLTFEKILQLSKVHKTHMDLITNEVNSANFGATLLAHLTASFEQNVMGTPIPIGEGEGPRIAQSPDNQFLYYAAHDINLLYVRSLLRLQWHTKGWHPHQPVPGSMLVFELHSSVDESVMSIKKGRRVLLPTASKSDRHFVKLYFVAASPEQMRNGEVLSDQNGADLLCMALPLESVASRPRACDHPVLLGGRGALGRIHRCALLVLDVQEAHRQDVEARVRRGHAPAVRGLAALPSGAGGHWYQQVRRAALVLQSDVGDLWRGRVRVPGARGAPHDSPSHELERRAEARVWHVASAVISLIWPQY